MSKGHIPSSLRSAGRVAGSSRPRRVVILLDGGATPSALALAERILRRADGQPLEVAVRAGTPAELAQCPRSPGDVLLAVATDGGSPRG